MCGGYTSILALLPNALRPGPIQGTGPGRAYRGPWPPLLSVEDTEEVRMRRVLLLLAMAYLLISSATIAQPTRGAPELGRLLVLRTRIFTKALRPELGRDCLSIHRASDNSLSEPIYEILHSPVL